MGCCPRTQTTRSNLSGFSAMCWCRSPHHTCRDACCLKPPLTMHQNRILMINNWTWELTIFRSSDSTSLGWAVWESSVTSTVWQEHLMSVDHHHCFWVRTYRVLRIYFTNWSRGHTSREEKFQRNDAPLLPPWGLWHKQQADNAWLHLCALIYVYNMLYIL